MKTEELYNKSTSQHFYDERYSAGYMDEWPVEKKQRVFEVIRSLDLPPHGEALDFGCGNGVFTDVLRQALPGWKIYGTDISTVAVKNASERVSEATFFTPSEEKTAGKRFDFLFTHHVLEHVFNLHDVWQQMEAFMKQSSAMLHILPCGNEGSFEHRICRLRNDGINGEMGNRFFFEDTGHVRRLTTAELDSVASQYGFRLAVEYYSNQHDGALDWITQNEPSFVLMLTDPAKAWDLNAKKELLAIRKKLLFTSAFRDLGTRVTGFPARKKKDVKGWLGLLIGLPLYPISKFIDSRMKRNATAEWESKKNDRSGSEMYLYFKR